MTATSGRAAVGARASNATLAPMGDDTGANGIVNRVIARGEGKVSFGRWDVWQHDPGKWDAARDELS